MKRNRLICVLLLVLMLVFLCTGCSSLDLSEYDNPEVRAYISQYYGPLDFDLADGKPEKSQVDEALSEFITPM